MKNELGANDVSHPADPRRGSASDWDGLGLGRAGLAQSKPRRPRKNYRVEKIKDSEALPTQPRCGRSLVTEIGTHSEGSTRHGLGLASIGQHRPPTSRRRLGNDALKVTRPTGCSAAEGVHGC